MNHEPTGGGGGFPLDSFYPLNIEIGLTLKSKTSLWPHGETKYSIGLQNAMNPWRDEIRKEKR